MKALRIRGADAFFVLCTGIEKCVRQPNRMQHSDCTSNNKKEALISLNKTKCNRSEGDHSANRVFSIEHCDFCGKGRILKHAGDLKAANTLANEARSMDLANRFINSECVKRMPINTGIESRTLRDSNRD
eukprot:Gb_40412 [translate_table: standard]